MITLTADAAPGDTLLHVDYPDEASLDDVLRVGSELVVVRGTPRAESGLFVGRGFLGSTRAAHASGATLAQFSLSGALSVIGPIRVDHSDFTILNSYTISLFTVPVGTVVLSLFAVFIEFWDGPSLPYTLSLGPHTAAGNNLVLYDSNAPSDANSDWAVSGRYGPDGLLRSAPHWVARVADLEFEAVAGGGATSATRGSADIYAIIATPTS